MEHDIIYDEVIYSYTMRIKTSLIKLISQCLYLADDDRRSKLIILSSITICWSPTKIQWPSIFYREDKGIEIHVKTKYHNTVTVSFKTKMDQWFELRWTLKEYKNLFEVSWHMIWIFLILLAFSIKRIIHIIA